MNKISLLDLYDKEFSLSFINAIKQNTETLSFFSCNGVPKNKNIFLYLNGCIAEYILKNGKKIKAGNGSFTYAPKGAEYTVSIYPEKGNYADSIGVNFLLFDENGTEFILSDEILVFNENNVNYKSMFFSLVDENLSTAKQKSVMYNIFAGLCKQSKNIYKNRYSIISRGISYLETDETLDLSVKEIAAMCNVSEIYFRKLFKRYSGMSPNAFKINAKLNRAKNYLDHGVPICEISEKLGFISPSYFTKLFKEHFGTTPSRYKD